MIYPSRTVPPSPAGRRLSASRGVAGLVLAFVSACSEPPPAVDFEREWTGASARGFNVLLVTLDTTRADRLGCYGHKGAATPRLDQLAASGVRFDDAVSPAPMTLPTHASILTGLNPPKHGVRSNGAYRLEASASTLAEVLAGAGYETAAFVSAFVLEARYGLDQGFDVYNDEVGDASGSAVAQRPGGPVTDAALEWLSARDASKPFFLWVHYFDPHLSYHAPEPFKSQFAHDPYDGEIAYMDAQIGRLVDALDERPAYARTVVVVVADHGQSLGEHDEATHSRTIYDATQRVPLILWSPTIGSSGYVVEDVVVGVIDVFPTVLDLLGMDATVPTDGLSLLDCRASDDRAVYMETMRTYLDHRWAPLFAVRRHRDKYILAPRPEYFDLAADPHERDDRFGSLTPLESKAVAELMAELAQQIGDDPAAQAAAARATALELDVEELRSLQALGYASGESESEGDDGALRDPKDMMPVLRLCLESRSLRQAGKLDEALVKASEALERSPQDRTALREVGTVYAQQGRLMEAEQAYARYLEIGPDADVYWTMAQILMRTGRESQGEDALLQALQIEPDHGGALLTRGDLAASGGDIEAARAFYEQALRVDPYRVAAKARERIARLPK